MPFEPDHTFYTNAKPSGIIPPKMESIEEYNSEIEKQQNVLDALHKQQYTFMLQNDEPGMSALDTSIKKTEQDIGAMKTQLGQVMGADIRGQRGNQLTQGDSQGYIDGMLHAYGNMGDGVKAEKERKDEAAILTTRPDPSDPGSSFWDTHEKPDPFRPGDPELAYAPLNPEYREDTTGRHYTYGSAPDSFADTGLVEPPKINDYRIGDEKHMTDEQAGYVLGQLIEQRGHVEKLGKRSAPYAEFGTFPERTEYYAAADKDNKKMVDDINKQIDAISTRLGDKYMTYQNISGLNADYLYESLNITDEDMIEEVIANSILKRKNREQLEIISCGVDEEATITIGEADEKKRTIELGDLKELQDAYSRLNERWNPAGFPFPDPTGGIATFFASNAIETFQEGMKEYVEYAGRYITFDVKIYSEPDQQIYTFKYLRYPGGFKNGGLSKVFEM